MHVSVVYYSLSLLTRPRSQQVTVMLQYVLYNGKALPNGLHGLVNAGANIGSVIGQFTFGYLADAL